MRKKFILSLWVIVFAMGLSSVAYGVNSYKTQFNNFYAAKGMVTAGSAIDSCLLCHTSTAGSASNVNSYGNAWAGAGYDFAAIESQDSDGDGFSNIAEITARTFPGDPNSKPVAADTTKPTVSAFTISATSSTLAVPITSLSATDNVGVTGYMVTESATAPAASAAGWTATAPTSYAFATAGTKTLYAWAKDAAGNVSTSRSASVTITVSTPPPPTPPSTDTTPPTVSAFTIPATSSTFTVSITSFAATDNVGVTGYRVSESATAPLASAAGWTATAPTNYTFATAGAKTLYVWVKDAAGNVSTSRSASVTITVSTPPPPTTTPPLPPTTTTPPPGTGTAPDMTSWVGKWFKVTEKDNGYRVSKSTLTQDKSSATAYLKIYDWDPFKNIFHVDRYEYDSDKSQWSSESIDLQYMSGSQKKFLCWYQLTDNAAQKMVGFTVLIQQKSSESDDDDEHESNGSTLRTLGGYYAESGKDSSGSSVSYIGGLTITGSEVPVSKVPVSSKSILR